MQKDSVFVDTSFFVKSLIAGDKRPENLLYRYLEGELILFSGLGSSHNNVDLQAFLRYFA